jgi:hypothetical protein
MAIIYDPRFQTWDDWAALMCEQYGAQNLEIPSGEENWKNWAIGFIGIDLFSRDGMPNPYHFDDWHTWVMAVNNTLSPS